jgi:chromosome segregation ATPase
MAPLAVAKADIDALDQGSRTKLIAAMRGAKAPLVEELSDMLDTLKENIPDEGSLYKAALKILAKKGFAITAIREDYDKCIGALESSNREFAAQLKGQLDARVGAKHKVVEDCNQQMADKQSQIAALQAEVATLAATAHEAENGIAAEQTKLNLMQERFNINYQALRTEMERNCAKVIQYGEKI